MKNLEQINKNILKVEKKDQVEKQNQEKIDEKIKTIFDYFQEKINNSKIGKALKAGIISVYMLGAGVNSLSAKNIQDNEKTTYTINMETG